MDSSDPHGSTSTSSNGENEKEASLMIQSKRAKFFSTYQHQSLSLPDNIMFYIAKNPTTPELYQKMVQTCKDFFIKNPVLVISYMDYDGNKWFVNEKPLKLDNLSSKFWITSTFRVLPNPSIKKKAVNESIASSVIQKIYRCDVEFLILYDQIISFDDLSRVISPAKEIFLTNVSVNDNNGFSVGIEKIVEIAVKAQRIQFQHPPITCVTSKTMKELVEIPHFLKLGVFSLNLIPEAFDLEAFYVYMKKNQRTRFFLEFDESVSDSYKNRLEQITDEIVAAENRDYKPPFIHFPDMLEEKEDELSRICLNN